MDSFDENIDHPSEDAKSGGRKNDPEKVFIMPEGAVGSDEIVGRDFWKGITLPETEALNAKRAKKRIHPLIIIVTALVFTAVGFGIALVTARGQGWLANLITGDKHISFTLPVADKPSDEGIKTDEQGRYSAEGLAEVCERSVVSLEIFTENSGLLPAGQGSGIIMTSDGYIVSNAHVVDAGTKGIKVVLSDGSEYQAKVIGSDPQTDIAVIKIPTTGLTPAQFGDSDSIKLGEEVVAIGSPAGYRNTVTKGIVSGLNRTIRIKDTYVAMNCIQIDAAINPGNSGGALFNMWGQVIGITSSKLASSSYDGIGFAISSKEAKPIIEHLMEQGKVTDRVKIGITFYPVSETAASMYGVKAGICIVSIDEGCDVANTELKEADIITMIDGKDVTEYDDVTEILDGKKAGEEITCHVYRAETADQPEKEFDITFKLMADSGDFIENDE